MARFRRPAPCRRIHQGRPLPQRHRSSTLGSPYHLRLRAPIRVGQTIHATYPPVPHQFWSRNPPLVPLPPDTWPALPHYLLVVVARPMRLPASLSQTPGPHRTLDPPHRHRPPPQYCLASSHGPAQILSGNFLRFSPLHPHWLPMARRPRNFLQLPRRTPLGRRTCLRHTPAPCTSPLPPTPPAHFPLHRRRRLGPFLQWQLPRRHRFIRLPPAPPRPIPTSSTHRPPKPSTLPNPFPSPVHPAQTEQGGPADHPVAPRHLRGRGLRRMARSGRPPRCRHSGCHRRPPRHAQSPVSSSPLTPPESL